MDAIEIKRGVGVSLWRQILEMMTDQIASGVIAPGEQLPTEHELAKRFNVNRHTVRRAMKGLEDEGLIRIEQGRGTFVQENVIDYPVRRRTRFSETLSAQKRRPGGWVMLTQRAEASREVADALEIEAGAPVIHIRTVGEADNRPVSIADHYFCAKRFPDLIDAFEESRSISRALARFGVDDYFRKTTHVTARIPDKEEAHTLNQPPNRPLLVTESVNTDRDGRPVEYGITSFCGDRVQLVFEP